MSVRHARRLMHAHMTTLRLDSGRLRVSRYALDAYLAAREEPPCHAESPACTARKTDKACEGATGTVGTRSGRGTRRPTSASTPTTASRPSDDSKRLSVERSLKITSPRTRPREDPAGIPPSGGTSRDAPAEAPSPSPDKQPGRPPAPRSGTSPGPSTSRTSGRDLGAQTGPSPRPGAAQTARGPRDALGDGEDARGPARHEVPRRAATEPEGETP